MSAALADLHDAESLEERTGRHHDLANLLTCMGVTAGSLEDLLRELEVLAVGDHRLRRGISEARRLAEELDYAGRLAVRLVRHRPQAGEEAAREGSYGQLPALLQRVARTVRPLAVDRAIVRVTVGKLPPVVGEEVELARVFLNLALNAIEAIPEGASAANEVRISALLNDEAVVIEVRDTGRGVDPALLARVFEPGISTSSRPGSGHGLTVTRSIVERLGGRLTLVPGTGAGVVARVELPLATA